MCTLALNPCNTLMPIIFITSSNMWFYKIDICRSNSFLIYIVKEYTWTKMLHFLVQLLPLKETMGILHWSTTKLSKPWQWSFITTFSYHFLLVYCKWRTKSSERFNVSELLRIRYFLASVNHLPNTLLLIMYSFENYAASSQPSFEKHEPFWQ